MPASSDSEHKSTTAPTNTSRIPMPCVDEFTNSSGLERSTNPASKNEKKKSRPVRTVLLTANESSLGECSFIQPQYFQHSRNWELSYRKRTWLRAPKPSFPSSFAAKKPAKVVVSFFPRLVFVCFWTETVLVTLSRLTGINRASPRSTVQ